MARKRKKKKQHDYDFIKFEITGIILIAISIISLANLGAISDASRLLAGFFMGDWGALAFIGIIILGVYLMIKRHLPPFLSRQMFGQYFIFGSLLLATHIAAVSNGDIVYTNESSSVIEQTFNQYQAYVYGDVVNPTLGGGMIGAILFATFYLLFDMAGSKIVVLVMFIIGLILLTGSSMSEFVSKIFSPVGRFTKKQYNDARDESKLKKEKKMEQKRLQQEEKENAKFHDVEIKTIPDLDVGPTKLENAVPNSPFRNKFDLEVQENVVQPDHFVRSKIMDLDVVESTNSDSIPINIFEAEKDEFDAELDESFNHEMNNISSTEELDACEEKESTETIVLTPTVNTPKNKHDNYKLPPISLLKHGKKASQSGVLSSTAEKGKLLENTLKSFGVKAKVINISVGPTVTQFEVQPDVGVKVSKIVSLTDDIALALAAKDIRIEAPIPGKAAVGIEVPNTESSTVSLREVIEESKDNKGILNVAFGRDISGNPICAEINKMPHLLVAGSTGSGKSVCINGIITSILMNAKPDEVKFMMIDPKMVELNVYNGIPHLMAPVVTDPKRAAMSLKRVVSEMERRYEYFSATGTRNIEGYNKHIEKNNQEQDINFPFLPYIVVIVDELADLMMVASSEVEDSIIRLAQMARAAGIHLIIATQRPSVNVITGIIKANIPSRISFAVSSAIDSRTILDAGGAEKLLGRGDMLFMPAGASKPTRIQGAFLSDEEVNDIVAHCTNQLKASYQEEMIVNEMEETANSTESSDEFYHDARELVIDMQQASVSLLQRKFRIGYSRAARLIDELEANGIVGPYEGSKPRTVLVQKGDS